MKGYFPTFNLPNEDPMHISHIHIYPIKSLGGISLSSSLLEQKGLQYDRRWMLIDPQGNFLTQRTFPLLAQFQVEMTKGGWHVFLGSKTEDKLFFPMPPYELPTIPVVIWQDQVMAQLVSKEADAWFSQHLNSPVRLVYFPDASKRLIKPKYAIQADEVSFADGFPTLILGEETLHALNARLPQPLPMNRFRPNLVFSGGLPHTEDTWAEIQIGDIRFWGAKPCIRCVIPTIDQVTSQKGVEPLKTLATYRKKDHNIYFGMNLLHDRLGTLEVGMPITVHQLQSPILPLPTR